MLISELLELIAPAAEYAVGKSRETKDRNIVRARCGRIDHLILGGVKNAGSCIGAMLYISRSWP